MTSVDYASIQSKRARRASQFIFLICGLGLSSWAPMVPLAKARLQLNDADLGLLLLLIGAGAIVTMPLTGMLVSRFGSRKVIFISSLVLAFSLPLLAFADSVILMGLVLFFFGCSIGSVDVAMNSQAIQVQRLIGKPIMSSLHGLFSVGGLLGPLGFGLLIKTGLNPLAASVCVSLMVLMLAVSQYNSLLDANGEKQQMKDNDDHSSAAGAWVNINVLFLGVMCFSVFLAEGAMLDWSAIYLKDFKKVDITLSGAGYATFSIAMAVMRITGDRMVHKLKGQFIVVLGSLVGAAGIFLIVMSGGILGALTGFLLFGIGAANIVPVLFTESAHIKGISSTAGISVITTLGYAGQLAGPALIGYVAQIYSLSAGFLLTAAIILMVAIAYSIRKKTEKK
jgi:predicted MFS family arabinose efflux permease